MIKKTFENRGEFLFITVPKGATGFIVDNAMQYFIFNLLNEKAYNKADQVQEMFADPLDKEEFTQKGGCKLPEGKFELLGLAFRLDPNKVQLMGYSNFIVTMIKEKLVAKETVILRKVN